MACPQKKIHFRTQQQVSSDYVRELSQNPEIKRIPGIGLLYSELVQGIPPIFRNFISNIPSLHSVIVLVSIKSIPISKVALAERYLFRQVEAREYKIFRCVVRYGYKDTIEEPHEFEKQMVEHLKEFIRHEHFIINAAADMMIQQQHSGILVKDGKFRTGSGRVHIEESLPARVSSGSIQSFNAAAKTSTNSSNRIAGENQDSNVGLEEELQVIQKAMEQGVFYLVGEAEVVAKHDSSVIKKFVVNNAYSFLRKNFREGDKLLAIPRTRLLKVGMVYEI
ncbi:hypothetical protein M9H77_09419 [Catharanthus roseus]|uniref:Uncharacterized protein n=1 Tax=Catharanthus roseus TaxID=4058 RepID=A0ACC0C0J8_CATRO|nr:hypothetical protein M9H77_09419 [Catharanthus roseus]